MAWSNPSIERADVPTEVPPGNNFQVSVTLKQAGPDPWASEGACTSQNLDISAWETPVELVVDGEVADEDELCFASGNTKDATLSTSLSTGQHDVRIRVYAVGGNAYDLQGRQEEVNDEAQYSVLAEEGASDPSRPSTGDNLMHYVEQVASALGVSAKYAAVLMALAVVLLLLLP